MVIQRTLLTFNRTISNAFLNFADYLLFSVDNVTVNKITPPEGGFWKLGGFTNPDDNLWVDSGNQRMAPFDQKVRIYFIKATSYWVFSQRTEKSITIPFMHVL